MSRRTVPRPIAPSASRKEWREARAKIRKRADRLGLDPAEAIGSAAEKRAAGCLGELREDVGPGRSRALAKQLSELQELRDRCSENEFEERRLRLADCEMGLGRLRELTTTAALIDGACDELVRSLGFERAMLARVEEGSWRPWKANAELLEEEWAREWIEVEIPLDELTLETRLLRERRPELVLDASAADVAEIVRAGSVRSYVVAPILPGGHVIGFFHADHGAEGRRCDAADRDLLGAFAEGFGHLYERTALFEQFQARREVVRGALSGFGEAVDDLTGFELELSAEPEGAEGAEIPTEPAEHPGLKTLTPRELEVLDLIVAGDSNAEIAGRLLIANGTVKAHVKSILAKLGVENRSQAIAIVLGRSPF